MRTATKTITIALPVALAEGLERAARDGGRTVDRLLVNAVRAYLMGHPWLAPLTPAPPGLDGLPEGARLDTELRMQVLAG